MAGLLPALLVGAWMAGHWSVVADGGRDLLSAHRGWLVAALAATGLGWVANALARQGTVHERLPAVRLVVTQFAATAAGQLAPAGIGASAVNLRFLRNHGLPLMRTSAALALYSLAESISRVTLLLVLLVAFPHALHTAGMLPGRTGMVLVAVIASAVLAGAVAVLASMRRVRDAVRGFVVSAVADMRSLHARPSRAIALWGGSLAFPVLQAASMAAVAMALDMPVPAVHVGIAYLAATCLAAVIPSPGGIGSVDAALALALVAAGSPTATAASAVLGFRIVTVWLPLVPAAVALSALIRRKVL
ncbi:Uncharacterized membrane protein YbhN, UPF0104 family [Actinacidiphila rubida]|uniref:Uncharacterized membrane protein YbhN, UPF0104 family n=3 Tax=Actinacidiphila rubida TaxID=310780 RepID=A0A1H8R177_9ACTN|nr:Uncharacterized membrane protein YbhN, UPF0104 family [Actinacidiphila rubida]